MAEKGLVLVVEDDRAIADLVRLYLRITAHRQADADDTQQDPTGGVACTPQISPEFTENFPGVDVPGATAEGGLIRHAAIE